MDLKLIKSFVKKNPQYLLIAAAVLVFIIVGFVMIKGKSDPSTPNTKDEKTMIEVPLGQRPFISLIPSTDGHWLKMQIFQIGKSSELKNQAKTLDYELLYNLSDGRTAGVPGTIKLEGDTLNIIERDLLLGSESSGKYRYDEGVEEGTLTLRFRNDKGKLVAKFTSDFHLQFAETVLNSLNNEFTYTMENRLRGGFFITMNTIGLPTEPSGFTSSNKVYGVFAADEAICPGVIELEGTVYYWDSKSWTNLADKQSPNVGIFASASEE